jgi:hypothetical protein
VSVRVRLLGYPRFDDVAGQSRQPPRGQKSWALLGRVALADRPTTRSELAAELFGEAADPLGALRWCLADLRRSCQDPQLLRGDPVTLAAGSLWLDVCAPAFVPGLISPLRTGKRGDRPGRRTREIQETHQRGAARRPAEPDRALHQGRPP